MAIEAQNWRKGEGGKGQLGAALMSRRVQKQEELTCLDLTTSFVHIARAIENPGTMRKRYHGEIDEFHQLRREEE